jgi:transcriptional regulator with XRE-family HTH domain
MKNTTFNKALAALVRSEREKRNWTQEHLATVADVVPRTVQRLESTGAHSPATLAAVAEAFDLDCQDLLRRAKEQPASQPKPEDDPFLVVHLARCATGKALLEAVAPCHAAQQDYPEDLRPEQASTVGILLDFVRDYADIYDDVEPSQLIQFQQSVTDQLNELTEVGLSVFCGAYRRRLKFAQGDPMLWQISIIKITYADDPRIVEVAGQMQMLPVLIPRKNPVPIV